MSELRTEQAPSEEQGRAYGSLPLLFAANKGQMDGNIAFRAQEGRFTAFFHEDGLSAVFWMLEEKGVMKDVREGIALSWEFQGASRVAPEGRELQSGRAHEVRGQGAGRRAVTDIPLYGSIAYPGLWPGIEARLSGRGGALKFDWLLEPGASVADIRLLCRGADGIEIDGEGHLQLVTPYGRLQDDRPCAYQETGGTRREIGCRYVLQPAAEGGWSIGFEMTEPHDGALPLVIDPSLVYCTYLGGTGTEGGSKVAVDATGHAYVLGTTASTDFPVVAGAFQTALAGADDVFVTKLNPFGTALVYSTYLGGSARETANDIVLDAEGNAYVTGTTFSSDFPTTPGAFQETAPSARASAYVTKLNPTGAALVYSTYLGASGGDEGHGIAIDSAGNAFVVGTTDSPDFPTTPGAFQPTRPGTTTSAYAAKLDAAGSALIYATYLGGSGTTDAVAVSVDGAGHAFVAGNTVARNFPTTPGAFQITYTGAGISYVTQFSPDGSSLVYSTYLGGSGQDISTDLALDGAGHAFVLGSTTSADFPTVPGSFVEAGTRRVYVTKFNPSGTGLVFSAAFGGTGSTATGSIALQASGAPVVTGGTSSSDYPVTPDAFQSTIPGLSSAVVTQLDPTGSFPEYSTYFGGTYIESGAGIAVDPQGAIYLAGTAFSADLPVTPGAFQPVRRGIDAYVAKLGLLAELTLAKYPERFEVRLGDTVAYYLQVSNTGQQDLTNVLVEDPALSFSKRLPLLVAGEGEVNRIPFVPQAVGPFVNTASASADQIAFPLKAEAMILVVGTPSILASKTASPPAAEAGQTIVYTIEIVNNGTADLTNLSVEDPLLGLSQTVDLLTVGSTFTIEVPFTIPPDARPGLTIANFTVIRADNLPTETIGTAVEVLPSPRLSLSKTADRSSVYPGDTVTFFITVQNTGNAPVTQIVVTDDLIGTSVTIPLLAEGETRVLETAFLVPLEVPPRVYTNTAMAVSSQAPTVTASVDVEVLRDPRLGIRKLAGVIAAAPGQTVPYALVVNNVGNVPLTNVRLLDPTLGFDVTIPSLDVGSRAEYDVSYLIPADAPVGQPVVNRLTASADQLEPQTVEASVLVIGGALVPSKTPDASVVSPGATVVYTLTLTNGLPSVQTGVTLSDPLLGLAETVPALQPGETIVRTVAYAVPAATPSGTVLSNTFTAGSDQVPARTAVADVLVLSAPAPTTLAILKLPDRNVILPGESIRYAVTVTNTGSAPATAVSVRDSLTGTGFDLPFLAAGETMELVFAYTAPSDARQGTVIANRAIVDWAENEGGPIFSEARVTVALPSTLIELSVEADPPVALPGRTVHKRIRIRNVSDQAFTNVRVIDMLVSFNTVLPSLAPGESRLFDLPFVIPPDAIGGTRYVNTVAVFSDQTPLQVATAEFAAQAIARYELVHAVSPAAAPCGALVLFEVRVRNTGNVPLLRGVLTGQLLRLRLTTDRFEVGAEDVFRIPYRLPHVERDTTLTSHVQVEFQNAPTQRASASVLIVCEEEE
ncbi:DUF7507 domain-containing protein [Paenibacillus albicereus]|nr:SBBP repeat-containing protein [Paenibacillus albicereus]